MKKLRTIPMRRAITAFLCGLMVFYTVACNYYKVALLPPTKLAPVVDKQFERLMYLHSGHEVFLIRSLSIGADQSLHMLLEPRTIVSVTPTKSYFSESKWDTTYSETIYYNPQRSSKSYNPKLQGNLVREVHFYLSAPISGAIKPGQVQLSASAFQEVHVLSRDKVTSEILGFFAGVGVLLLMAVLIFELTVDSVSCPYVYVYDGHAFLFQGEIFSGATFPNMERHDYLPLPQLVPVKGEYQLRIANELQENQFVNLAQLQAIRHPEGTQALFDVHGAPQLIAAPQRPLSATSALGNDASALTAHKDGSAFLFDEEQAEKNRLTLQFENRPGAANPKLVLHAANSLWVDQLVGRYLEKWGDSYPQWAARQAAMSYEQRQAQNIHQDFYLSAFVKNAEGAWQLAGRFPLAGPMARRDMLLPLDPALLHGDKVDIRLETAYRFWEIDYAAMDFSDNTGMQVLNLPAQSAKDQNGRSQLKALASDDALYLQQLRTGDYVDLRFKAVEPLPGQTQTFFLHAKGYYEYVRDYSGAPKMDELEHFRKPHYFDQFSKEEYRRAPMVLRVESDW